MTKKQSWYHYMNMSILQQWHSTALACVLQELYSHNLFRVLIVLLYNYGKFSHLIIRFLFRWPVLIMHNAMCHKFIVEFEFGLKWYPCLAWFWRKYILSLSSSVEEIPSFYSQRGVLPLSSSWSYHKPAMNFWLSRQGILVRTSERRKWLVKQDMQLS